MSLRDDANFEIAVQHPPPFCDEYLSFNLRPIHLFLQVPLIVLCSNGYSLPRSLLNDQAFSPSFFQVCDLVHCVPLSQQDGAYALVFKSRAFPNQCVATRYAFRVIYSQKYTKVVITVIINNGEGRKLIGKFCQKILGPIPAGQPYKISDGPCISCAVVLDPKRLNIFLSMNGNALQMEDLLDGISPKR